MFFNDEKMHFRVEKDSEYTNARNKWYYSSLFFPKVLNVVALAGLLAYRFRFPSHCVWRNSGLKFILIFSFGKKKSGLQQRELPPIYTEFPFNSYWLNQV